MKVLAATRSTAPLEKGELDMVKPWVVDVVVIVLTAKSKVQLPEKGQLVRLIELKLLFLT